jgi:hypothetical protein
MCALYEYDIMRSTGKLRFARGTHENLIYLPKPPAVLFCPGMMSDGKKKKKNMGFFGIHFIHRRKS